MGFHVSQALEIELGHYFLGKKLCNHLLTPCPWRGKNVIRRQCFLVLKLIGLICSASVEGGRTNGRTCNSLIKIMCHTNPQSYFWMLQCP